MKRYTSKRRIREIIKIEVEDGLYDVFRFFI